MDNKTVALVGALLVLGVAVYGMATGNLPGFEQLGDEEQTPNDATNTGDGTDEESPEQTSNDNNSTNNSSTQGPSEREQRIQELATDTGLSEDELTGMDNERLNELLRRTQLGQICENQGEEVELDSSNVPIRAGPPFNGLLFESMLHEELNKLRTTHSNGEPLKCDPVLRNIARNHSRLRIEGGKINSTSARYEGVCENPRENSGKWLYQRDREINPSGGGLSQRTRMIKNHEEFVRDVRGAWFNSGKAMSLITYTNATRQGVGAYIDRDTREVVVTHTVC